MDQLLVVCGAASSLAECSGCILADAPCDGLPGRARPDGDSSGTRRQFRPPFPGTPEPGAANHPRETSGTRWFWQHSSLENDAAALNR
jgi:hypothetical protein